MSFQISSLTNNTGFKKNRAKLIKNIKKKNGYIDVDGGEKSVY